MASRADLQTAYGKLLFRPMTAEAMATLSKRVDARSWDAIAPLIEHIITTPEAAAGILPYMLEAVLVLDRALKAQVYLGGALPIIADVAIYFAARPAFAAMSAEQRWAVCNASRWCAHLEHELHGHGEMAAADPRMPPALRIVFDRDMPPGPHVLTFRTPAGLEVKVEGGYVQPSTERGVNATGKGRHKPGGAGGAAAAEGAAGAAEAGSKPEAAAPPAAAAADAAPKKAKKEKGEKAAAPPKAEAEAAAAAGEASEMSRLDIRVGVVKEAAKHPDADNLYVEQIDCGDSEPRTVVSGLAGLVPLEALVGARVVVVCNLKPATMKGVESKAMVLCASEEKDGAKVVQIVTPPEGAPAGERVAFAGHEGPAEANPNVIKKKKVWEAVAPDLRTDASGIATYKGIPFTTSKGPCKVASLANAQIK